METRMTNDKPLPLDEMALNEKRIYLNSIIIVKNFLFFNLAHFNRQSPATYLLHFHPLEDLQS